MKVTNSKEGVTFVFGGGGRIDVDLAGRGGFLPADPHNHRPVLGSRTLWLGQNVAGPAAFSLESQAPVVDQSFQHCTRLYGSCLAELGGLAPVD